MLPHYQIVCVSVHLNVKRICTPRLYLSGPLIDAHTRLENADRFDCHGAILVIQQFRIFSKTI